MIYHSQNGYIHLRYITYSAIAGAWFYKDWRPPSCWQIRNSSSRAFFIYLKIKAYLMSSHFVTTFYTPGRFPKLKSIFKIGAFILYIVHFSSPMHVSQVSTVFFFLNGRLLTKWANHPQMNPYSYIHWTPAMQNKDNNSSLRDMVKNKRADSQETICKL